MSAYPTTPAFVNEGDWSSVSDSHPAMKWMHAYTERIDEVCAHSFLTSRNHGRFKDPRDLP